MSGLMPSAELRARVLDAARREPVRSRQAGSRRRAAVLAGGVAVGLTCVLVLDAFVGGPAAGGRPAGYVAAVVLAWAVLAAAATWGGMSRGGSMLGRPAAWGLAVAVLTPIALQMASLAASLVWPEAATRSGGPHAHAVCLGLTLLIALGPLVAFSIVRRSSDPVSPRRSGAAIGAAAGAWGAVAIEMHCPFATPMHIALGHVLPVALLAMVGVLVGDRVVAVRAQTR